MAEQDPKGGQVEGEGSYTAAREYREHLEEHLRRADVNADAERASKDLDEHGDELRRAEEEGKSRSAGDLAEDLER
jgi:hypothetical protein